REGGEGHPTPIGSRRLFRRADPLRERLAPWLRAWDRRSYPLLSLRHALSPPSCAARVTKNGPLLLFARPYRATIISCPRPSTRPWRDTIHRRIPNGWRSLLLIWETTVHGLRPVGAAGDPGATVGAARNVNALPAVLRSAATCGM